MNTSLEAIRARHEAQRHFVHVIESMLDGDSDDAHHHIRLWNERRLYAQSFETASTKNEVTADQQEAANLRRLITQVFEHFEFSEYGLPDDLRIRMAKAAYPRSYHVSTSNETQSTNGQQ